MPNYRRPHLCGATWFITVVTYQRRRLLAAESAVETWRRALRQTRDGRPFTIHAAVVLPDHCHLLVELPQDDSDISARIGRAKALFTKMRGAQISSSSASRRRHRESDAWQRRFFDRVIRDETEYERYVDYIHFNPVKHGYVSRPADWPYSSIHRFIRLGVYPPDWGAPESQSSMDFSKIERFVGE